MCERAQQTWEVATPYQTYSLLSNGDMPNDKGGVPFCSPLSPVSGTLFFLLLAVPMPAVTAVLAVVVVCSVAVCVMVFLFSVVPAVLAALAASVTRDIAM